MSWPTCDTSKRALPNAQLLPSRLTLQLSRLTKETGSGFMLSTGGGLSGTCEAQLRSELTWAATDSAAARSIASRISAGPRIALGDLGETGREDAADEGKEFAAEGPAVVAGVAPFRLLRASLTSSLMVRTFSTSSSASSSMRSCNCRISLCSSFKLFFIRAIWAFCSCWPAPGLDASRFRFRRHARRLGGTSEGFGTRGVVPLTLLGLCGL
mmetsp:Transcript_126668/g.230763  ORF Transcript_126668/g.230763 Transcript_126668/m.230763 type:complete len:212 (-) Transcript_126668:322-957(-)